MMIHVSFEKVSLKTRVFFILYFSKGHVKSHFPFPFPHLFLSFLHLSPSFLPSFPFLDMISHPHFISTPAVHFHLQGKEKTKRNQKKGVHDGFYGAPISSFSFQFFFPQYEKKKKKENHSKGKKMIERTYKVEIKLGFCKVKPSAPIPNKND